MQSAKLFLSLGAINAALAVVMGAFGAHALKARLTDQLLHAFQTAVQYHFYHALGLIVIGILMLVLPSAPHFRTAAWFMMTGIVLFSGSLYLLAIFQMKWLGPVTPLGGAAFIIAWVILFAGIIRL